MTSFRDFDQTLATLTVKEAGDYIYFTAPELPDGLTPFAIINEEPAVTGLIPLQQAKDNNIEYSAVFTRIILDIEDSLNTPGLTAAVSQNLASMSITCNVVTGYYYAHVFVPREQAQDAIRLLEELSEQARGWVASDRS